MAFYQRLQEVRRRAGLTQEEFAEVLQVSRQAVSKWESGRGYPEMEKLLYICSRYRVSMGWLFAEEAPEYPNESDVPAENEGAELPRRSFTEVVGSFVSNLSPKNRLLGVGAIFGCAVVALLIGALLKGGSYDMILYIWIGLIVFFGVLEAATAGLTSIWFVLGSVAGLVVAICRGPLWLQILIFFLVSIAALIMTRPLVKKMAVRGIQPTNLDQVLGQTARVTEEINNVLSVGAVYIQGKTWSARSEDESIIPVGTLVTVKRMSGVKLYVGKD